MTYEDAKNELMSLRYLDKNIIHCREKIERLRSELLFTNSVIIMTPAINPPLSAADKIRYKIDDEITRYEGLIDDLETVQSQIESRIEGVEATNALYGQILRMRFLRLQKLEEIAIELHYSYLYVRKVVIEAMHLYAQKYSQTLKKEQKGTCQ